MRLIDEEIDRILSGSRAEQLLKRITAWLIAVLGLLVGFNLLWLAISR